MAGTQTLNRAEQFKDQFTPTDARIKRLNLAIKAQQKSAGALIEVLHAAQDLLGYLPLSVIRHVAKELNIAPSRVYGVATFYHFFSLKPKGEHTCLICTGTACHVRGAQKLIDKVEKTFNLKPGETTADNKLGVQTARCFGSCGLAPAVVLDNEMLAKIQPDELVTKIKAKIGS